MDEVLGGSGTDKRWSMACIWKIRKVRTERIPSLKTMMYMLSGSR